MDIGQLSTVIVTTFLIPIARKSVEQLHEDLAKKTGKSAAQHITTLSSKIWEKVTGLFKTDKEKNALELFRDDPDNMAMMIEKIIREKLKANPALAQELEKMINTSPPGEESTSLQIMNKSGIVGFVNLPNSNFQGAHGVNISAVNVNNGEKTSKEDDLQNSDDSVG
jgi:hypothetical protein